MNPTIAFPFDFLLDLMHDVLFREKLNKPFLKDVATPWTPAEDVISRAGVINRRLRANSPQPLAG